VCYLTVLYIREIKGAIFTRAKMYCDHASLLVGWFVRSFVRDARCDFSESSSQIFVKVGTDLSICAKFRYQLLRGQD